MKTPVELGYRLPAEWEEHAATWLAWPHNASDWPGKLLAAQWAFVEIVRRLTDSELVRVLVPSAMAEKKAQRMFDNAGVSRHRLEFFRCPTDRSWARDFGPIFLTRAVEALGEDGSEIEQNELAIARFRFNGWARYSNWRRDDRVPEFVARKLGKPIFRAQGMGKGIVLEGGAIDVNGHGRALMTEECMLDKVRQVRNPGLTREELEDVLAKTLGITEVIWLWRGIVGDDTHGHIDDFCRFVGETRIALAQENNPADENYRILQHSREQLEELRLADGSTLELVFLPMPAPLYFHGQRLPASYANFYIANKVVLVPTFNDRNDSSALGIIGELFPDRTVVGIHAVDLVWGLGAIHCLTQQEPKS